MDFNCNALAVSLIYTCIWTAVAASAVGLVLGRLKARSLGLQQVAWFMVLLPVGFLVGIQYPISISLWQPAAALNSELDQAQAVHERAQLLQAQAPTLPLHPSHSIVADTVLLKGPDTTDQALWQSNGQTNGAATTNMAAAKSVATELFPAEVVQSNTYNSDRSGLSKWLLTDQRWVGVIRVLIVAIWMSGFLVVGFLGLLRWTAFHWLLRDAMPARRVFARQWQQLCEAHRLRQPLPLLEHATLGPMLTVTSRGMTVVIPADFWEELNKQQRLSILRHELAHYERGDIFWSLLLRALAAVQWFNPLAWLALRRWDEAVELSCDAALADDYPQYVTDYAQALVQLIEYPSSLPLASRSIGGTSVIDRIHKLLNRRQEFDSVVKQSVLIAMLILLLVTAFLRVQVFPSASAAQEPAPRTSLEPEEAGEGVNQPSLDQPSNPDDMIQRFLSRLHARGPDEEQLVKIFKEAMVTPAGQVVMANSVQEYENQLRDQAESTTTYAFASELFEKSGDKFVLKPAHKEFPARFEAACIQFEQDTASVARHIQEVASRIIEDREVNRLVKRYLLDKEAPYQVYIEHVQPIIRPDYRVVREHWQDVLVLDRDNRLVVRTGARRLAQQQIKSLIKARQLAERLQRAIHEWKADLSQTNPHAKAFGQALSEPLFSAKFAVNSLNEDYSIEQTINNYFEYLENLFVDQADGLVPTDEAATEVQNILAEYNSTKAMAAKVRPHLTTMSRQLAVQTPELDQLRQLLDSDLASVLTITRIGTPAVDVESALKNWFGGWLAEVEDGRLSVPEDQEQNITDETRQWLRNLRSFRRKGLDIVEFGKQLEHPGLSAAYQTTAGKCLVLRGLQDRLSRQYFDGFGAWLEENFDASDDGYALKEGHESILSNMLESIESVKQELANDDF